MTIFKELMATRATKVSPRHVEALNAIEIEFSSGRGSDQRVADAWRLYLDHLNQQVPPEDKSAVIHWHDKSNDLLIELLFEMSKALKFDSDKVSLKNAVYFPRAHGELETDQFLLRKLMIDFMAGRRPMWTGIFTGDNKPIQMQLVPPAPAQPNPNPPDNLPAALPPSGEKS